MRMYNFYFSPKLSAISHPVIFYTAFQFASFFSQIFPPAVNKLAEI